jgi:hypothetical protein
MRRITHMSRTLGGLATMLATVLLAAALPLAGIASNYGPGGP